MKLEWANRNTGSDRLLQHNLYDGIYYMFQKNLEHDNNLVCVQYYYDVLTVHASQDTRFKFSTIAVYIITQGSN